MVIEQITQIVGEESAQKVLELLTPDNCARIQVEKRKAKILAAGEELVKQINERLND